MKPLLSLLFLSLATPAAHADYIISFKLGLSFGNLLHASGNPACTSAIEKAVDAARGNPPTLAEYSIYKGSFLPPARGVYNAQNQTFRMTLTGGSTEGFDVDRTFTGTLNEAAGQAELIGNANGSEACLLDYDVNYLFGK
jgi:hypothetical protein